MPLHLLGKKSWNVYSKENVERVRRDEAAAIAREEEENRRMQAHDAERRIAILRGERQPTPPTTHEPELPKDQARHERHPADSGRRKRRRLAGEDDTDRDLRLAKETAQSAHAASNALLQGPSRKDNVPLHDNSGHINLFPIDTRSHHRPEKNAEVELEKKRKDHEYEDQYTMRFSNAAGKGGHERPWYAGREPPSGQNSADAEGALLMEDKDAWGRADPRRREREQSRSFANDPLAFMKKAQTQLKQSEADRKRWKIDRQQEMHHLDQDHRVKRRKRRYVNSSGDVEAFDLDATDARPMDVNTSRSHREQYADVASHGGAKSGQHRRHG